MIVDRIEDGIAVLEGDDGVVEVPASWLPRGAREGSVLRIGLDRGDDATRLVIALDPDALADREAEIQALRERIPEGPGGDIIL